MFWGFVIIFIIVFPLVLWNLATIIGLLRARGVPYVPLNKKQLGYLQKYIKLQVTDSVVDLGCGDGRVLRLFEKQGVKKVEGYEINFWAYLRAQVVNSLAQSRARVFYKNFRKVNLEKYNIVFCYLLEGCLKGLRQKFDKELRPGAKLISFGFPIKEWRKPEIIYTNESKKNLNRIFIYYI